MIEVYYSKEIGDSLIYLKDGNYKWSDYNNEENYYSYYDEWEEDVDPTIKDSPEVYIKIFEMEYD